MHVSSCMLGDHYVRFAPQVTTAKQASKQASYSNIGQLNNSLMFWVGLVEIQEPAAIQATWSLQAAHLRPNKQEVDRSPSTAAPIQPSCPSLTKPPTSPLAATTTWLSLIHYSMLEVFRDEYTQICGGGRVDHGILDERLTHQNVLQSNPTYEYLWLIQPFFFFLLPPMVKRIQNIRLGRSHPKCSRILI